MPSTYTRRVSTEEAREGYLMVEKARLAFFPAEGKPFELAGTGPAKVESYACECRGPDKAHRHWFIRLAGLVRGATVTIRRDGDRYTLEP
ncbi:MAG: hypothetical protein IT303_03740 [Dehalococcoidia bacterium]|nr:hypothetical protein [Dehalococcoidia bacterium]